MNIIISCADDYLTYEDMSDYIVSSVWGFLTGFVYVSQSSVGTVNYDDWLASSASSGDAYSADDRTGDDIGSAGQAPTASAEVLPSITLCQMFINI